MYRRTITFSYIVSTNHKSRLRIPTKWGPTPELPDYDVLVRRMEKTWGPLDSYSGLATAPGKGGDA